VLEDDAGLAPLHFDGDDLAVIEVGVLRDRVVHGQDGHVAGDRAYLGMLARLAALVEDGGTERSEPNSPVGLVDAEIAGGKRDSLVGEPKANGTQQFLAKRTERNV